MKNNVLIAIIISVCIIAAGILVFSMMNEQTTTVKLSETCSIDISGNINTSNIGNGINQIKNSNFFGEKAIIYHFNSANKGLSEVAAFGALKTPLVGNTFDTGANPIETTYNGEKVYVCYKANNNTHDNILIIAKNRDDCIKMYKSIKYNTNTTNNPSKTVNTTVVDSTVEKPINNKESNNNNQDTYVGKDGKTHTVEEAYSVDYSSGDLNNINQQRSERGMSQISA